MAYLHISMGPRCKKPIAGSQSADSGIRHAAILLIAVCLLPLEITELFLTQQYRLFSNYSASLQEMYVVRIVHELLILLFGIGQLLFVRIRYVGAPPIPPQIGIIVGFGYVEKL